ncbi:DUF4292 domain-containing protein [Sphingobacterium griseoflavum]|uniref:DUF4292 domain-containing protein n=1 Tax=Sphingobacterium griseoflavum TaxID=1474952 RepID=A0ABQ3I103_9SPHI|nr:DUF4292 domain-containing protein [Sphingobacterium griseoflavum]GHE43900.1 hypothetical protein GCM10017764_29020 [Sphingobacterium griseoflavum]
MWNRGLIILLCGLGLLAGGCKTKQRIKLPDQGAPTAVTAANEASIKSFEMSNLDFHTFSGRAKTKVELDKQVHDLTLNVRIQRDKAIWMSVTATLGIEVARILITPDSVQILNKLAGEYIAKPFSYIYHYTNRGVNFHTLQDLLIANVSSSLLRNSSMQVASATDEFIVVGLKEQLSYQYRINKANRPFNFVLQEVGGSQNLEAFYSDYAMYGGYNFPNNTTLNILGDQISLKASISYNRVTFNDDVAMPFSVSGRYKVIN